MVTQVRHNLGKRTGSLSQLEKLARFLILRIMGQYGECDAVGCQLPVNRVQVDLDRAFGERKRVLFPCWSNLGECLDPLRFTTTGLGK
jgi:hypothetical protein